MECEDEGVVAGDQLLTCLLPLSYRDWPVGERRRGRERRGERGGRRREHRGREKESTGRERMGGGGSKTGGGDLEQEAEREREREREST